MKSLMCFALAAGDDPHYPDDLQAAEARVAAQAAAQRRDAVHAGR